MSANLADTDVSENVSFGRVDLTQADTIILAENLKKNVNLTSFCLAQPNDVHFLPILVALKNHPSLIYLTVYCDEHVVEFLSTLVDVITSCPKLESIHLNTDDYGYDEIPVIMKAIKLKQTLYSITLSGKRNMIKWEMLMIDAIYASPRLKFFNHKWIKQSKQSKFMETVYKQRDVHFARTSVSITFQAHVKSALKRFLNKDGDHAVMTRVLKFLLF